MTDKCAVLEADRAQAASPGSRFSANLTSHSERSRNGVCIVSNCANLGEILETVKVLDEGDAQSWYAAWKATADLALAQAERTENPACKDAS